MCHANTFAFKTYITFKSFLERIVYFLSLMHQEIFIDHLHVPHTDLGADSIVVIKEFTYPREFTCQYGDSSKDIN